MSDQHEFEEKYRREMSLGEYRLRSLEKWREEVSMFFSEQVRTNALLTQNCALLQSTNQNHMEEIRKHDTEIDGLFKRLDYIVYWVVGTGIALGMLVCAVAALVKAGI